MTGAYGDALELLDDDVLKASSRAPALKVEMMHHLGLYSDAVAASNDLAAAYPGNEALMGALAILMLDAERPDLAEEFARKATSDSDGQAALGMLALGSHEPQRSLALFDRALTTEPENPRAWIGKGLSLLAEGDAKAAAQAIDRGAGIFGDHLGSWVASGWAHFVARDYKAARQSFERAITADPNFSESHGGLAVLDILDNRFDEAERRIEIALRLNKKCFGAALAKSLLLERGGHAQIAKKVLDMAMSTPVGLNGETIAEAAIGFSRARQRPHGS
jgi:tetratricopeptide (TPR) repeat protein